VIEELAETEWTSRLTWVAERDPDRALALLAGPKAARDSLILLFILDLRLAAVADRDGEPAAAMLRLAWWRDALTALDTARAPAEPMLQAISRQLLSRGISGGTLARIAEGWLALAEDEAAGEAAMAEHAAERGATLFSVAARLCGVDDAPVAAAGAAWALAERATRADPALRARLGEAASRRFATLPTDRWPRRLRVLGTLVVLARHDLAAKSRTTPRARFWRALRHRLTGG
jgi:phytoene synthase